MQRDIEYEKNNIGYDWQYTIDDGDGIKCKNYELCEKILPKWWFECKRNYLCTLCHMMFGTWDEQKGKGFLPIIDNKECPICLNITRSISQPNCEHTLCLKCFKRCYYGDEDLENEPIFPYPDIEDNYYDNPNWQNDNPNWQNEYPLIEEFNNKWNKWDDSREEKRDNETYLHNCPLCRS